MADVSERRIRPVQDAVDGQHWKQALQLCEKWHKKGEKSDRFQVIRAYVLVNQHDAASIKRGRDEIVHLCNRTPAITDIDSIYQLQSALRDLHIEDDGARKLWERAAAARPDDKDIAMTWLDEAIDRCDWQSAQKATMALRKISPKDRNYEFWTIVMCYLIYEEPSISEKERNLFGTLAYRMLSKAAEAVPQDTQQMLSAGRAIQSPEELFLLVRVYLKTDHVMEAKGLLMDSKTLGPESGIFELDHDLHRSLQLEVLEASGDWSAVMNELRQALEKSSVKDLQLSRMLKFLIDAGESNENIDLFRELRERLEKGIKALPNSRDLHDGFLRLLLLERAKGRCTAEELMEACKQYFVKWSRRLFCFDELQHPIASLDATLQQDVVNFAQDNSKTSPESGDSSPVPILNTLKLEYSLLISMQSSPTAGEFACKAIRLFRGFCGQNIQSQEPVAQMATVASMAMLEANRAEQGANDDQTSRYVCYLQIGFLLRYCLTKCKDDYPTLVVLTLVSRLLGAMSLSAESFKSLSIKNLQWENVGHLLLTRLSTLHPHRLQASEGGFDPLEMLNLAVATNFNSVQSVKRHILAGLNHKSYINVMETIRLREDLRRSFSKQLYCVEKYRVRQLGDLPNSERDPLSSGSYADHRDFSFIPSFEHPSAPPFVQKLEAGPKPKEGWLRVIKIFDAISDLMHTGYHEPQSIKQDDVEELGTALDDVPKLLKSACDEFTNIEINTCQLHFHLGKALVLRLQKDSPTTSGAESDKATFDSAILHIQTWLTNSIKQRTEQAFSAGAIFLDAQIPVAPSWEYLHSTFSILECLQLISLFLAAQAKPTSSSKSKSKTKNNPNPNPNPNPFTLPTEQRTAMTDLVFQIEKGVHDTAKTLKENLNTSGVLGRMIDAVFGRSENENQGDNKGSAAVNAAASGKELEQFPDAETVAESFCGEVKASWADALDGILWVKVPRYK